ncbi:MAG: AlpA family phage regulatory protein [Caldilineaceae bacterium SB0668_bin_21]|nr:AlpA family phage regulatory protein [Caldilineaceae bacterium SB0668_bin_21]
MSSTNDLKPIFLRLPQACQFLGIGRSALYKLLKTDPTFPRPVTIVGAAQGWRVSELEQWAATRPPASTFRPDPNQPAAQQAAGQ